MLEPRGMLFVFRIDLSCCSLQSTVIVVLVRDLPTYTRYQHSRLRCKGCQAQLYAFAHNNLLVLGSVLCTTKVIYTIPRHSLYIVWNIRHSSSSSNDIQKV